MDERCIRIMEDLKNITKANMQIVSGDALQVDIRELSSAPRQIVSNLPYNISVPLLVNWLKQMPMFEAMTLMFQKEVADRITSPIKSKDYGRVSVLAQLICRVDKLMDINPECFVPAPKIWSSVLLFRPLDKVSDIKTLEKVEKITSMAFGQRRKMIRQSLKGLKGFEEICTGLNIPVTKRAEELTPQEYLEIARRI